ncbi:MAG: ribosomal L7Ae/L30e/S12e/Gadd45 family protein [Candidatus Paraimprobicoccus trichonymphae]|uniref:Ribosomal L7Ae/L30e/S12e/Gadd45 family protein n=1 Tax=Candidatus Paraimprobicoccus trichonymphae TaxID=3033793 RepID=A0AA48IHJ9_9FIRM|nr:MAG: ribosomal L7Ae/L30e/S12e/Gadd45 family protein [Candidatus Paraimprobicoccus trichonymphae]
MIVSDLLNFVGIVKKSGNLVFGFGAVKNEFLNNKLKFILLASDISENTENKIRNLVKLKNDIEIVKIKFNKSDIEKYINKFVGIIGILDLNMVKKIKEILLEKK